MGTPVSSGNRGVMALGASLVRLCREAGAHQIAMFVGHHQPSEAVYSVGGQNLRVRVVNYRLSPRARPCEHLAWIVLACLGYRCIPLKRMRRWLSRHTPWIAELERTAFVGDIRGGDSFSDLYGWRRFVLGFLATWSVLLVKGRVVYFPQTYGPYQRRWTAWLAGYLLRRSRVIVARDRESQRVAQELVGDTTSVWLSPDVAFALEACVPAGIETDPPLPANADSIVVRGVKPIGVNVNGLMYTGGYTQANMFGLELNYAQLMPGLIEALLREHEGELWLIPHTYAPPESVESDPEVCLRVRAALPPSLQARVRIVTGEYDCDEIKGVIGQCDFFLGSRMHACIAALSQGIPTVGIAYSRKFEGVFESVGVRDWVIDGRHTSNEEAIRRALELYRQREGVRERIAREAEEAPARLREVFAELVRVAFPEDQRQSKESVVRC